MGSCTDIIEFPHIVVILTLRYPQLYTKDAEWEATMSERDQEASVARQQLEASVAQLTTDLSLANDEVKQGREAHRVLQDRVRELTESTAISSEDFQRQINDLVKVV